MSELHNKFNELISEQKELANKFQVTAQALFKETTKVFFENNPAVKAIVWTQYSPFFNDGEECVFSVNDPTFTNAEGDDLAEVSSWGEYEGENDSIWACDSVQSALDSSRDWYKETRDAMIASGLTDAKDCDHFSEMITSAEMQSVMEAMFGNHAKVIATKDGFDVEEYDHD